MRAVINHSKSNVLLWTSPKSGSSTTRSILCSISGYNWKDLDNPGFPRKKEIYDYKITSSYEEFTNIAFIRNPYDRFISGVFQKHIEGNLDYDCYKPKSMLDAAQNISLLDKFHFEPQTSDQYSESIFFDKVFDINNIDYKYLSSVFDYKITPKIENVQYKTNKLIPNAYRLSYDELLDLKKRKEIPQYKSFYYNNYIKNLIYNKYEQDFFFAKKYGINYG
jgi:hypothetical protein